jgi:hypothetical protein
MTSTFKLGISLLFIYLLFFGLGLIDFPASWNIKVVDSKKYIAHFSAGYQLDAKKVTKANVDSLSLTKFRYPFIRYPVTYDTIRDRVLLIGDSQVEGLKSTVSTYCEVNNHELVASVIYYGASTLQFGTNNILQEHIDKFKPTVVIFVIGLNELFVKDLSDRADYIKRIVQVFEKNKVRYIWVGPAAWTKDNGIINLMKENVGDCFFPSHTLTLQRASDKRHPSKSASKLWFDEVASWADSLRIINLSVPVDTVSKNKMGKVILLNANKE